MVDKQRDQKKQGNIKCPEDQSPEKTLLFHLFSETECAKETGKDIDADDGNVGDRRG